MRSDGQRRFMEDEGQLACAEEVLFIHTTLLLSSSIMLPSSVTPIEVAATKITNPISDPAE